jgi:hypothetical protein
MASGVITIDRITADLLGADLRVDAERLEGVGAMLDRGEWRAARGTLADAGRLIDQLEQLEQLGSASGHDARGRYKLTVDLEWFIAWLQRKRDDLLGDIAYELAYVKRVEEGSADFGFYGDSPQESIALTQLRVAEQRSELTRIEALVGSLGAADDGERPVRGAREMPVS